MAIFRVERTRDYTVMCNRHLRDENISLKAKGLLSMMLSLPDDWNYTTKGLAAVCKGKSTRTAQSHSGAANNIMGRQKVTVFASVGGVRRCGGQAFFDQWLSS